jgi:hypothetical protein
MDHCRSADHIPALSVSQESTEGCGVGLSVTSTNRAAPAVEITGGSGVLVQEQFGGHGPRVKIKPGSITMSTETSVGSRLCLAMITP